MPAHPEGFLLLKSFGTLRKKTRAGQVERKKRVCVRALTLSLSKFWLDDMSK